MGDARFSRVRQKTYLGPYFSKLLIKNCLILNRGYQNWRAISGWRAETGWCHDGACGDQQRTQVRGAGGNVVTHRDRPELLRLRRREWLALTGGMPHPGGGLWGRRVVSQPDRHGETRLRPRRVQVLRLSSSGVGCRPARIPLPGAGRDCEPLERGYRD